MTTVWKPCRRGDGLVLCIGSSQICTLVGSTAARKKKTRKQALFTKRRAKVNSLGTMQCNSFRLRMGRRRAGTSMWTFPLCGPLWEGSCQLFGSAFCPEAQSSNSSGNTNHQSYWFTGAAELFSQWQDEKKTTLSCLMSRQHPAGSSWVETRKWREWSWIPTGWAQMAGGDS